MRAADTARDFGAWWAETHDVPVFFYDGADPEARDLPHIRRTARSRRARPTSGPRRRTRRSATAVGARKPLVAVNLVLVTGDVAVAQRIAREVRESGGGLPGVRALGFMLESKGRPQVSMNLVDLDRTGIEDACLECGSSRAASTDVASVEVVGLVPRAELDRCSDEFVA